MYAWLLNRESKPRAPFPHDGPCERAIPVTSQPARGGGGVLRGVEEKQAQPTNQLNRGNLAETHGVGVLPSASLTSSGARVSNNTPQQQATG